MTIVDLIFTDILLAIGFAGCVLVILVVMDLLGIE